MPTEVHCERCDHLAWLGGDPVPPGWIRRRERKLVRASGLLFGPYEAYSYGPWRYTCDECSGVR